MQKFAKLNKGYRYLLTCIDIFSKFAWVIPLKNKRGITIKNVLEKIFKENQNFYGQTEDQNSIINKYKIYQMKIILNYIQLIILKLKVH